MTADRRELLVEVAATLLLGLAAVATAWSGYQAAQWHGEQAVTQGKATSTRLESTRASDEANRQVQVDVAIFTQWVDAYARGEQRLATFYERRFRDRFRPAFDAWLAQRPLANPAAAPTPFDLREYQLEAAGRAEELQAQAEEATDEVQDDVNRADHYVLAAVFFATALALAGIGARLKLLPVRLAAIGVGWVVFLGAVAWLATFPVDL